MLYICAGNEIVALGSYIAIIISFSSSRRQNDQ